MARLESERICVFCGLPGKNLRYNHRVKGYVHRGKCDYGASHGIRGKLKLITVNLPEYMVTLLGEAVKQGMAPHRSEAIRDACREYLQRYTLWKAR